MAGVKKQIEKELLEMEKHLGRMLRNMSLPGMGPFFAQEWRPCVDVYETDGAIIVYVDAAGMDPASLSVTAETGCVTVSGIRRRPIQEEKIRRIHQLEIEHGRFSRAIPLPAPIDLQETSSSYRDGLLEIRLPKQQPRGKIEITVS